MMAPSWIAESAKPTPAPVVSVVMGVFNEATTVRAAVESILCQRNVALELVVVDDGSTDATPAILQEMAAGDARIRFHRQAHAGVTRALIHGCGKARGDYLARHDADDVSHPDRLSRQVQYLQAHPGVVLASCWARLIGPEDEELMVLKRFEDPREATRQLRSPDAGRVRGLTRHGTAMFRRDDYERVGGYREAFFVAQDVDLWMRLTDRGTLGFVPEELYTARLSPLSISARLRREQTEALRLIVAMRKKREAGRGDDTLLEQVARLRPRSDRPLSRPDPGGLYFIGRCLLDRRDPRCLRYLGDAIRRRPWWPRAWMAWLGAQWALRGV